MRGPRIRMSFRNRLTGIVESLKDCAVMVEVVIRTDHGAKITAVITRDAAENIDLRPGVRVEAAFKAGDTLIGVEE